MTTSILNRRSFNQASGFIAYEPPPTVISGTTQIFTRRGLNFASGEIIDAPPEIITGTCQKLTRRLKRGSGFNAYVPPDPVISGEGIPAPRLPLPVLSDVDDTQIITRGGAFALNFTADDRRGLPPHTVQFTNLSQSPVDRWTWEFGDGNTSNEKDPIHTYLDEGSYDVKLIAGAPVFGFAHIDKYNYIIVGVLLLINPQSGKAPLKVSFNVDERQL